MKEFEEYIESSFCYRLCSNVYSLIKLQFPDIEGLSVDMDDEGSVVVIFEETKYTSEEVNKYLNGTKKELAALTSKNYTQLIKNQNND